MARPPKPRRAEAARAARLAPLLASLALAACLAGGGGRPSAVPAPPVASGADPAAFRALAAALRAGQDAQAGALVQRLRQGPLTPAELGLVESAERVLAGRALVRGLELGLASEPVPDAAGRYRLVLEARSSAAGPVRLRLPPADLKRLRTSIDARGVEELEYESRASHALAELLIPPGASARVVLLEYELALGRALAVRERWRLEPRAGEIECDGRRYPAQDVCVAGCERERVSPLVAAGPVDAAALAARLEDGAEPGMRELLELALRTPPESREEALRALAPAVARLARAAPERVAVAEPALRWLTQNRDLGPDAGAWARYLTARASGARAAPGEPAGGLDLPERTAPAPRPAEGAR